jgi:glycogen operon protein
MLTAGDEMGRTQRGNNNAYCQANEISWVNWELDERRTALLDFTRRCIRIRQGMPVLLRRSFFLGETLEDSRFRDLAWFRPDGHEMTHSDWQLPYVRCLGLFLGGDAIATLDPKGRKLLGDTLFILLNAHYEAVPICLPGKEWGSRWDVLLDTAQEITSERALSASARFLLHGRSMLVLVQS